MPKLKAPVGTDEANYGEERFPVTDDGTVEVPAEAVQSLVEVGGFTEVETPAPVEPADPSTFAKMHQPDGSGCSFDGENYDPDENGFVHVPQAAVSVLLSHGLTLAE